MKVIALTFISILAINQNAFTQKAKDMKTIRTEIIIDAPAERVWEVLMDFDGYPDWNPFIREIRGGQLPGDKLTAKLYLEDSKPTTIKPKVQKIEKNRYFEWLGKLPLGMFNGRHYFEIEEKSASQVKFTQGEYFSGWLRKPVMKKVGEQTRDAFIEMNSALKVYVE